MRFLHPEYDSQRELALDDVFLVPGYYEGVSRLEVDLRPLDFVGGSHPLVSANMNAVTGKRMAETMARYGGMGVLPQDMSLAVVERIVAHCKQADPRFDTPLSVIPQATLRDVLGIIRKRAHGKVIVVDEDARPIGVVAQADLRDRDQYTPVERVMSKHLVSVPMDITNRDAFLLMERERLKAVPVVDAQGRLCGILTREDAVRMELLKPSLDAKGRLMIAAAVGISSGAAEIAERMVDFGVDAIVLDTAHGHQRRMIEAIRAVRAAIKDRCPLIAGNVCTAEGTRDLIDAGADIIKVNVGPGAMCTTRMQTGVGRPSFSSVLACATEARKTGHFIWADGGVRYPRDVALYLAAGAARVMIGTMLAGTFESPGDIKEDHDGALYKENYGMASGKAVLERTAHLDPFEQAKKGFFREGISTSRIYLRPGQQSVGEIVLDMMTGVQSSFSYIGAQDCQTFQEKAVIGVQGAAGFYEGTPHGQVRK
jgi:IMP dehydrogenase